jgi:Putative transposase/Transposase zinc-binding domain
VDSAEEPWDHHGTVPIPSPLTRWTRLLTAPSRDWSVCQQLVADHWEALQHTQPRYQTPYDDGRVAQRLACGNPEKIGDIAYRCLPCGQGKQRVAMSCQASLCLRCAKVQVDHWVSQVRQVLHEGVIYRHIMLTVPAMFRTTFYQHAAVVWRACMRCGGQCLDDFYSAGKRKPLQGGSIVVLHTHGRKGQSHPHLQVLATSGGYEAQGARWEPRQYLPYDLLRRKWQWYLLTMLRQRLRTEAIAQVVNRGFRPYPDGLVTNGQKGHVPAQAQRVARYGAQDVVSPPIAGRRIDRYEGERGTDHDRSQRTARREYATVPVDTFIGRMVQHTMPKGCKRIRYYGVQATKTFAKVQEVIQAARAKGEAGGKGAVKIIARLTSRQR